MLTATYQWFEGSPKHLQYTHITRQADMRRGGGVQPRAVGQPCTTTTVMLEVPKIKEILTSFAQHNHSLSGMGVEAQ
jgi:hypothetical protein